MNESTCIFWSFRFLNALKIFDSFLLRFTSLTILLSLSAGFTFNIASAQKPVDEPEEISMLVHLPGFGFFNIDALYTSDKRIFLDVFDLFTKLQINCNLSESGDSLSGFINIESNRYLIDSRRNVIQIGSREVKGDNLIISSLGRIFLESGVFSELFGLELSFNFRSLVITVKSSFELPLMKQLRLEKTRNNIKKIQGELFSPDSVIARKPHIFKLGTLNWSLIGSQLSQNTSDNQIRVDFGMELFKGEFNLSLNYSSKSKFDSRQQQFQWHWVDNAKNVIKQVYLGKLSILPISTIYAPVYGATISNTPTFLRRSIGFYNIRDYTEPDWIVELYINNSLVDFTRADASGLYQFKVPLVYGFTNIHVKFFGPNGEERHYTKKLNIPFNFMPINRFEYKLTAGVVGDSSGSLFGKAEGIYGINRRLTIGGGMEFLSSVSSGPFLPFISLYSLPLNKLLFNATYTYGVGFTSGSYFFLPKNTLLELYYNHYWKGQTAVQFNYTDQVKAAISIPLKIKSIGATWRNAFKTDIYSAFIYNQAESQLSASYRSFSLNATYFANWVTGRTLYSYTTIALSYRFRNGIVIRGMGQFNYQMMKLTDLRFEAEKQVLKKGLIAMSYERNLPSGFQGINLGFRYNLPFSQVNLSTRLTNFGLYTSQGFVGSLAFGGGNGYIDASIYNTVGRGGLCIVPFIDKNHDGILNSDEHLATGLIIKGNGGRIINSRRDSIIRIFDLEPFTYFDLELREADFANLSWRLVKNSYRILIDPNQFKRVEIPISPMGEVTGSVLFQNDSITKGLGRIQVNIFNTKGKFIARAISESDGYISYIGLLPGEYFAEVDSIQRKRIKFTCEPVRIPFTINPIEEGDIFDGIEFTLQALPVEEAFDSTTTTLQSNFDSAGSMHIMIIDIQNEIEAINIQTRLRNTLELLPDIEQSSGFYTVTIPAPADRQKAEELLEKIKNQGYTKATLVPK